MARNDKTRRAQSEAAITKFLLEFVGDEDRIGELDWLLSHLRVYLNRLRGFCIERNAKYGEFTGSTLRYNIEVAVELINSKRHVVDAELLASEWSEFLVHLNQVESKDSTESLNESLRLLDLVIDKFATMATSTGWKKGNW